MTVRELIERLKACPPDLEACVWDAEAQEFVPITDAVWEDGSSIVDLEVGGA